jgi:hypothetical protein
MIEIFTAFLVVALVFVAIATKGIVAFWGDEEYKGACWFSCAYLVFSIGYLSFCVYELVVLTKG